MDVGTAFRSGLTPETLDEALLASARERTKEARGEQGAYMTYIPETKEAAEATGSVMLAEAVDYYLTDRGLHETAQNKLTLSSGPKELFVVDGATHVSLYDQEEHLSQAVAKLGEFFGGNLPA